MDEAELIKRLLETFRVEAGEHLNTIAKNLIELEKDLTKEEKKQLLEEIYRSAHSMKGAARAVNLTDIEKICQSLESCFSMMKKDELQPSSQIFDIFHSVINTIEMLMDDDEDKPGDDIIEKYIELLNNIDSYQGQSKKEIVEPEKKTDQIEVIEETLDQESKIETEPSGENHFPEEIAPDDAVEEKEERGSKTDKKSGKGSADTIRLASKKIDEIYLLAEESLQIKLSHKQEVDDIKKLNETISFMRDKWASIYSEIIKLRHEKEKEKGPKTNSFNSKLFTDYDRLNDSFKIVEKNFSGLLNTARYVENTTQNIIDTLVDEVKSILMVPFSNMLDGFPRIVRDLAKDMKKEVDLEITGSNVEVDRRIMELLYDPLIHIIRNSIDHGIEKPSVRKKNYKKEKGKISIDINQTDANHVKIEIADDGCGINKKNLLNKAVKNQLLTKEEASKLPDDEVLKLIFRSGISTSSIITDISGRGLGLAIVEEKTEELGGKVHVDSIPGKGCTFSLEIPTSVSRSQGLLVGAGKRSFIIPVSNILETLRIKTSSLQKVENRNTIQYNNKTLPLVNLTDVLQISQDEEKKTEFIHLVIIESLKQRIGFIVDDVVNEQEVLFKPLGYPLLKVRNIAGVSLLGTGEICPILNSQDLIRSAAQSPAVSAAAGKKESKKQQKQKSIILAEDSITSRLFLKNILEGAGYQVKATIDGREALTSLKQEKYDMLVSDIEMPRMNGFELTEAVRSDKDLSELPIVLVTSLNKREDQEKGIDVGANAYIIKSSFEQSNLLEVIKRLI